MEAQLAQCLEKEDFEGAAALKLQLGSRRAGVATERRSQNKRGKGDEIVVTCEDVCAGRVPAYSLAQLQGIRILSLSKVSQPRGKGKAEGKGKCKEMAKGYQKGGKHGGRVV